MKTFTLSCIECGQTFLYERYRQGRLPERCPECKAGRERVTRRAISARYREAHPERAREQWNKYNRKRLADPVQVAKTRDLYVLRKYGLTPEQLQEMLDQTTECGICGGPPSGMGTRFHIDHCHNSGRVRGLLCSRCNTLIGLAKDNPETLEKAAAYLRT